MNIWTTRYLAAAAAGHFAYTGQFWLLIASFSAYTFLAFGAFESREKAQYAASESTDESA